MEWDTEPALARPSWWYKEALHCGIDYADVEVALKYDAQHSKFRDFEKDALRVIEKLGLTQDQSVIDIGCGTGAFVLTAARHCKKVYAVDVSAAMLEVCRRKAIQSELTNLDYHCAGFLTYEHQGEPVDAVVSVAAFHHLPDFWKGVALTRIHSMLKPGGKFYLFDVVFGFPLTHYAEEVNGWVEGMRKNAGDSMADETATHIRDEHSTYDWIMDGLFERAGFQIEFKESEFPRCLTYVCRKL